MEFLLLGNQTLLMGEFRFCCSQRSDSATPCCVCLAVVAAAAAAAAYKVEELSWLQHQRSRKKRDDG